MMNQDLEELLLENLDIVIGILVGFIVLIAVLALYAFFDAPKRGMKRGVWLATCILLGPVGFVIYLSKRGKVLPGLIQAGVLLSRAGTGIAIVLLAYYYVFLPLASLQYGVVDLIEIWPTVGLAVLVLPTCAVLAFFSASNRVSALLAFFCNALVIYAAWGILYENILDPGNELMLALLGPALLLMVAGGFAGLFNFFGMCFADANYHRGRGAFVAKLASKATGHKVALVVAMGVILGSAITGAVSVSPSVYNNVITITPQDFDAEIAFWAAFDNRTYTDVQKAELNQHNATLVVYHPPNIMDPERRQYYLDQMNYWKDHYPNVRFVMSIQGWVRINNTGNPLVDFFYNTFPYDGSAEGVILWAKEFMNVSHSNNLTNFVGVNTDQEAADEALLDYGVEIGANATRHAESVQLYNEFFEWRDLHYPDYVITSTMGEKAVLDEIDGDDDLQVADKVNLLDVDGWDEIAPMIYRCGCEGTPPYGDLPRPEPGDEGRPSSYVYYSMRFLQQALLHHDGNTSRLGVYLGITNCTCYGADVEQYDRDGNFVGYGYDQLVKDALIAKHFGSKIITLFILNTAMTSSKPDAHSMGGVFDSYGDGFLDDFMEDINGENSTVPFELYLEPDTGLLDDVVADLVYDLNKPVPFAAMLSVFLAVIVAAILLHPRVRKIVFSQNDKRTS